MKIRGILSVSKDFLRTREAVEIAPSVRGLIRHVNATVALHDVFPSAPWGRMAFGLWRLVLVAVSETGSVLRKTERLWRL